MKSDFANSRGRDMVAAWPQDGSDVGENQRHIRGGIVRGLARRCKGESWLNGNIQNNKSGNEMERPFPSYNTLELGGSFKKSSVGVKKFKIQGAQCSFELLMVGV